MSTTLPTRPLGSSGLDITPVGFGGHALELGVNWVDTAAVYGLGHSEEVVGRRLRDLSRNGGRPAGAHLAAAT